MAIKWQPIDKPIPAGCEIVLVYTPSDDPTLEFRVIDVQFLSRCKDVTHWASLHVPEEVRHLLLTSKEYFPPLKFTGNPYYESSNILDHLIDYHEKEDSLIVKFYHCISVRKFFEIWVAGKLVKDLLVDITIGDNRFLDCYAVEATPYFIQNQSVYQVVFKPGKGKILCQV